MSEPNALTRPFVTPEGVDLELELAAASERMTAFLIDVVIITVAMVAFTLALLFVARLTGFRSAEAMVVLWVLGAFVLRCFYFVFFEQSARAATPGKRLLGLRVVMRDGSPLSLDAVFARNAMRELEIFVPILFMASQANQVQAAAEIAALVWCGVFVFFPVFNRDRLRIGDMVAGTWVVHAPKRVMEPDIASQSGGRAITFTREQLDVYGIKELAVLEEVLRKRDPDVMRAVAARIRAKIGYPDGDPDEAFLLAFYAALRKHLESRLLLGKRKRDKYDR
ncbi:RDD family protein [Rhizomicrobium electricum]|uniref:RDD family protein n=1 Tax=Rhizomicrobium electricum TaxID=480070 RepID=A0ABP3PBW0_9PROT|nr:putative RDD family membrane protein YckC [Rhizomicrobium electricum]